MTIINANWKVEVLLFLFLPTINIIIKLYLIIDIYDRILVYLIYF